MPHSTSKPPYATPLHLANARFTPLLQQLIESARKEESTVLQLAAAVIGGDMETAKRLSNELTGGTGDLIENCDR